MNFVLEGFENKLIKINGFSVGTGRGLYLHGINIRHNILLKDSMETSIQKSVTANIATLHFYGFKNIGKWQILF